MNGLRSKSLAVFLSLSLLHLAGCGGDDEGASSGEDASAATNDDGAADDGEQDPADVVVDGSASGLPDPCELLTVAQLEGATQLTTFGEGEFNDSLSGDGQAVCDWVSDDPFATAQVLITPFGDSLDTQRASVEDAFDEPTVDLDLADGAYRTQEGSIVAMRVGSLFVQVSYIPPGPGEVADATVQLAGNALEALG